jgi:diguanylate cyclase (GGDEF)-like protein/PAS domain S-box-containing protein
MRKLLQHTGSGILGLLGAMLALLLLLWLAPMPFFLRGNGMMPLWVHTASELFSIVVAMLVFGVAWNVYKTERHGNLLILACGLLAVGLLDALHMLSFVGMPDLVTPSGPEKTINFWLAARFLSALVLLVVAVRPWRPLRPHTPYLLLAASVAVSVLVTWIGLFHPTWWPRTFDPDSGLTPFKIGAEYAISLLLLLSAWLFLRAARQPQHDYDAGSLFAATAVMVMSELCFTLYSGVTDLISLLGHVYKIVAYGFIYRAVFAGSVRRPLERLQQAREELASSREVLQSILDNAPVRIFWRDRELRYLGANPLYLQDIGIDDVSRILGRRAADLFPAYADIHAEDDLNIMRTGMPLLNYEEPLQRSDGETRWLLTSKVPLRNSAGEVTGILGTYNDISERKQAEELIRHQASYDALTQLPNRRLFQDRLQQEIEKCRRYQLKLALILLDIDDFKEINDTMGHALGDDLLQQVAQRLQGCVRGEDSVARLGGDEFCVIVGGLDAASGAERISQEIMRRLAVPFRLQENEAYLTVSIGLTLYPDDGDNIDTLLRNVDQAMYAAKRQGRNRYSYFTPAMQQAALNRMELTRELRNALAEGQLRLVYQPIVELASGGVHKAEALIRWQHPRRGLVSPAEFIPIAEASGLIVDIGDWVFYQAARQARRWRSWRPDFQVSINKSPVQFSGKKRRQDAWFDYLRSQQLPGSSIVIEITEGLLLDASDSVIQTLQDCRAAGMQVSLDDFGTGYSSLSYLKKFHIDYLKIDQSFVANLAPGTDDMVLCEAIIQMAHKLGIRVVAEGVETEAQRALLLAAGCDYGQGYLFSPPLAPAAFEPLLKRAQ